MTFLVWYAVGAGLGVLALSLLVHAAHLHGAQHPRLHFHLLRRLHVHLSLALVGAIVAGFVAGAIAAVGYAALVGPGGPVQPPAAAFHPRGERGAAGERHGLGLLPPRIHLHPPQTVGAGRAIFADLSAYAPSVPDQGATNSCGSWAVAYMLRGYYALRQGDYPRKGLAPLYVYAQLTHGTNTGTRLEDNLALVARQGVDSWQDYPQQRRDDYRTLPTRAQHRSATRWRSLGLQVLFAGAGQGKGAEQIIRQTLAGGDPVVIGYPVYDNVLRADSRSYYITKARGRLWGLHAAVALKTDANGVWLLGSWSVDYGLGGWIEVSYDFLDRYAEIAATMLMPPAKGGTT